VIWIWAAVTILVVMLLLVFVLGLLRAASMHWDEPDQYGMTEEEAERQTRPNGSVTVLHKDDE
jgi:cytochrome bd-type quinol oxidase subunit 1